MQRSITEALGLILIGIVIGVLLSSAVAVVAGNLDAPGGPTAPAGQMYTLAQIYNRLVTGATGTKMSVFTEPSAGPSVGTMHTLDEIMAVAPTTHTHAATQTHILSGTVAWGLNEGAWGVITGTRAYAPVPKTGQTTCYNAYGTVINCADTGQDGEYQLGIWLDPRFSDNGDGTVTDNMTGLIWLKDTSCPNEQKVWADALTFANSLYDGWTGDGNGGDCGLSDGSSAGDWRLPNIRELQSVMDYGESNPGLPSDYPFINVQTDGWSWSSTTSLTGPSYAWFVNLYHGVVDYSLKVYDCFVWPVRGGQ